MQSFINCVLEEVVYWFYFYSVTRKNIKTNVKLSKSWTSVFNLKKNFKNSQQRIRIPCHIMNHTFVNFGDVTLLHAVGEVEDLVENTIYQQM